VMLLLPWFLAAVRSPRLLLADPSSGAAAVLDPRVLALSILPALVLALASLWRSSWRRPLAVWAVGLCGLCVAAGAGFWGPGVSLLLVCALGLSLRWLDGAAGRLKARRVGWRHVVAVSSGLVAVAGPIALAAVWVVTGWTASPSAWVHRSSPDVIPAVAAAEAESPAGARTLVLAPGRNQVRWALSRAGGPRFGFSSAALPSSSSSPVVSVIGGLISDTGADVRAQLADLDIGSVFLLASSRGDATAQALDAAPGLVRVTSTQGGVLWRVELTGAGRSATRPARVRVLSASGALLSTLPSRGVSVSSRVAAGPPGRVVVLAERYDPGWTASLAGRRLRPVRNAGWAQAFRLPAGGGALTISHTAPAQGLLDVVRTVVLVVAVLLAVPLPGRRRRFFPPPAPPGEIDLRLPVPEPRSGAHVSVPAESLALASVRPPRPAGPDTEGEAT
jgi:hypothetical protein